MDHKVLQENYTIAVNISKIRIFILIEKSIK